MCNTYVQFIHTYVRIICVYDIIRVHIIYILSMIYRSDTLLAMYDTGPIYKHTVIGHRVTLARSLGDALRAFLLRSIQNDSFDLRESSRARLVVLINLSRTPRQ